MTSIPSLASKTIALSLLSGLRGKDTTSPDAQDDALGKPAGPWAAATGLGPHMTPEVRAELMRAAQAADKTSLLYNFRADGERDSKGHPLIDRVSRLQFSIRSLDLTPEEEARLKGADTYVRLSTPQLEQKEFEEYILLMHDMSVDTEYSAYAGFKEARANGTLKIHRAIDVEGLNFNGYYYDRYVDGYLKGTQGSVITHDKSVVRSYESQGLKTALGDAWGQLYFLTWPDPAAKPDPATKTA